VRVGIVSEHGVDVDRAHAGEPPHASTYDMWTYEEVADIGGL
jgi:hypothetical protein